MFGDFILQIKQTWKRFWCIHDYKRDEILMRQPCSFTQSCSKCGRIR